MSSSNKVTLQSSLIQAVTYVSGSLVITTGEDSSPPPEITRDGSDWTIDLKANRKKSNEVASSFAGVTGGASHMYAPDGGGTGHAPEQLNFYFGVNITFSVDDKQLTTMVYLAQGNYSSTNNWWIGGNAVVNVGTPSLVLTDGGSIVQTLLMSGGTHDFEFKKP